MGQVVTVDAKGVISGLQVKPGKGFDLRKVGHATIERVSEIEWREEQQAWTIRILDPDAAMVLVRNRAWLAYAARCGVTLTLKAFQDATGLAAPTVPHVVCGIPEPLESDWLYFNEYEDAVTVEVMVLDNLRRQGRLLPN